jgi:predicted alpha-1,6-mannanase (GH76 family)
MLSLLLLGFACLSLAKPVEKRADKPWAEESARQMFSLYNNYTGLWQDQWWPSANTLTSFADLHAVDSSVSKPASIIYTNTYQNAPHMFSGFINGYYDDEGWWALAWIQVYRNTKDQKYLDLAESIFQDMRSGLNGKCDGLWWDKSHTYVASIANELFIATSASLANLVPSQKDEYLQLALKQYTWLLHSGVFTSTGTILDGLNISTCKPQGAVWTYNQGVILGALVELNKATGDSGHIEEANRIATAAITQLAPEGILGELCDPGCESEDVRLFKGIFMRNLAKLVAHQISPPPNFKAFIADNARSVWTKDRTLDGEFGPEWTGGGQADYESTTSGFDALVAAVVVGA